jgi:hypothetical protein
MYDKDNLNLSGVMMNMHDRSLSWLGKGTSIKVGGNKLDQHILYYWWTKSEYLQ